MLPGPEFFPKKAIYSQFTSTNSSTRDLRSDNEYEAVSQLEHGVGLTKLVRARLPKLETELRYVLQV
jgi:hypothetical protein